jgi:hypothetical protein
MAIAVHHGGPQDGVHLSVEALTQTRHYAPKALRLRPAGLDPNTRPPEVWWVQLARYVFTPPQRDATGTKVGKFRHYTYTGMTQAPGPVAGDKEQPDWST